MNLAKWFFKRFAGLKRAHGKYELTKVRMKGKKKEGQGSTVREPPTVDLWAAHLEGKSGIGIVPIRDDGTVSFGAIDIDDYNIDMDKLEEQLRSLTLPLILCTTKSGGAHLYLFLSEPVPAELVRAKLMDWAVILGYSGIEVFPKQTRLANQMDVGNWINMPYFGGPTTDRRALFEGEWLMPDEFLLLAELLAVTEEQLKAVNPPEDEAVAEALLDAPPCLQCLARTGFPAGTRNVGLFNLGVYLRKRYGDEYKDHMDELNQQFMDPPLGHKEVQQVERNVAKKNYEYRCSEPPIVTVCNRQICLTRKWGIGTADGDPGVNFGILIKVLTDPPTWIWDIDGARIELTTSELKDQNRFHTKCMEVLNKWPNAVKPKTWANMVRQALEGCEQLDAPPDASQEGTVWAMLQNYCNERTRALSRDELVMAKPWVDDKRIYFSAVDFRRFLSQQRISVTEKRLWNWLRERGAKHKFFNLKGQGVNTWSLPLEDLQLQDESFDIPEYQQEDEAL